ncbi:MAG TPA: YggT family protein [Euzebyales bacterium]|nr:YggT family protein [Euzebyales bacterium]
MATSQPLRADDAALTAEAAALRRRSTTVRMARAISYLAYAFVIISLVILLLGFVLKLLAASPEAGFTQWVYRHLDTVMQPFRGIFPQATGADGSVLDVSILFAMLVYALIALGIRSLLDWLTYRLHRIERQHQLALVQDSSRSAGARQAARPVAYPLHEQLPPRDWG